MIAFLLQGNSAFAASSDTRAEAAAIARSRIPLRACQHFARDLKVTHGVTSTTTPLAQ
jgi:hypothetical protein